MVRRGLKTKAEPRGPQISEANAFDILCAKALEMERSPQQVVLQGSATGWYERIKMLADNYGWSVTITVKDK